MKKNKNKLYVGSSILGMVVLSLVVSLIMAKNFKKDTSKLRHDLTVDYKEFKEIKYSYDESKGRQIFNNTCSRCHGSNGSGTMTAPSFIDNSFVLGDSKQLLKVVISGLQGKLTRHGKEYNSSMPGYKILPHADIAHVLNYIRNSFGNSASEITAVEVITSKVDAVDRNGPWKVKELK
jgi:mono/diheme cytochrome c family protein